MIGYGRGRGFYKNNFAVEDDFGDDDDMQDYDPEYYAEESEDDGARYMPNYPPGAMFQQPKAQPKAPAFGAVSSASGVPFYGQQNKPAFAAGGGFGGAGGNPGGFTYGMAGKGGNLFGAAPQQPAFGTQFGAP